LFWGLAAATGDAAGAFEDTADTVGMGGGCGGLGMFCFFYEVHQCIILINVHEYGLGFTIFGNVTRFAGFTYVSEQCIGLIGKLLCTNET